MNKRLSAIPALHRATHAVGLYIVSLRDARVTQAEAHILAFLHERGSSTIGTLHDAFGHRRSTLTSVLDRLEKRRLLNRTSDTADRRAVIVKLTKAGETLGARVHEALYALEQHVFGKNSAADAAAFERVCEAIVKQSQRRSKSV
jgi:DNA-binding MarR family transcriptional regulator